MTELFLERAEVLFLPVKFHGVPIGAKHEPIFRSRKVLAPSNTF